MRFLKVEKVSRHSSTLLTVLLLTYVLVSPCAGILNTGSNNIRPNGVTSICESRVCKCKPLLITCNCGSTTQGEELAFEGTHKLHDVDVLHVENCRHVRIPANMLQNLTTLRTVKLINIGKIIIEGNGFSWKLNESSILEANPSYVDNLGSIIINIENSVIPNIPSFAFQGRLEAIMFHKTQIGNVYAFAFSNLFRAESIQFTETNFTNLEPQAFKKFSVETIKFLGGNYGSLPSRTMVDLEVTKSLVIEKITFNQVLSSALMIKGPETFRINGCRFTRVEGDAFRVVTNGPVYIQSNTFVSLGAGAFAGITVSKHFFNPSGPQKLVFEKNNITHFENGSLVFNTSRIAPQLDRLFIEQACSCNSIKLWADQLIIYPPYSPLRKKQQADNSHRESTVISCRYDEKGKVYNQYINFQDYNRVNCGAVSSSMHIFLIVIIVGVTILLLALGVVIILCVCRRRRARWINVPTSNKYEESPKKVNGKERSPDSRITMVVPDGRMYRETEFHVIVEQAEPITTPEEHIYQNLKPKPLPRNIKQPVPQMRTDL